VKQVERQTATEREKSYDGFGTCEPSTVKYHVDLLSLSLCT